jgi:hypothetical protein
MVISDYVAETTERGCARISSRLSWRGTQTPSAECSTILFRSVRTDTPSGALAADTRAAAGAVSMRMASAVCAHLAAFQRPTPTSQRVFDAVTLAGVSPEIRRHLGSVSENG